MSALLLWICLPLAAQAESAVDTSRDSTVLGPHSRVIEDESASLSVDQVLALERRGAGQRGDVVNSYTFNDGAYWLVTPLRNPTQTALERLLVFEPTWLDEVRVYLVDEGGVIQAYHGGDRQVFDRRSIDHRKINVALQLPPGESRLLVRVQTVDPFVVGVSLWEREAFYRADNSESMYIGLLYGVLVAMLLYNLVLFISVRDPVYAAYVAYVLFFVLMHATYNGFSYQIGWPDSPRWGNWAHSVFIYLFISAGLYFAINFLELRRRSQKLYNWAWAMLWMFVASFVVTALGGGYELNVVSSILWIIAYSFFAIFLGSYALISGNRAARYFLPATTAGFLGSGITALAVSGVIPFTTLTYRAADIGMMVDAILLSIALADRLKLARSETERVKAKLLQASHDHARELEEVVQQRTMELQEANATKDKFFSIIAHDLRSPIGSLALFYNDIVHSATDFTEEILQLTRRTTNTTSNLLEQLLTWARSQRGDIDFKPRAVDLRKMLKSMKALYAAQASAKEVSLSLQSDDSCWVYADAAMVQTVLRNLISNALKYTHPGGRIEATLAAEDGYCRFTLSDNGIGIDPQIQQTLFRLDEKPQPVPGTQGEEGSGLGLILCREFIDKNGGEIGVHSREGKGTDFWFTLPVAQEAMVPVQTVAAEPSSPLRILVADDRQISRRTAGKLLQELGHSVSFATEGAEALHKAMAGDFDLILMDIDMPLMSGIEVTRRLRSARSGLRVIAWSSYTRKEIEAMDTGVHFDGYLDKPLSREALDVELSHLFRSKKQVTASNNR